MPKSTDISAGPTILGTWTGVPGPGQRQRFREQILQVHSGHRGAVWSWPAEGHRGDEGVIGLWDRVGQNVDDRGRYNTGIYEVIQPFENRWSATNVPECTMAGVP